MLPLSDQSFTVSAMKGILFPYFALDLIPSERMLYRLTTQIPEAETGNTHA